MLPTCQIALKEWAVVCEALLAGRQTILLRKGGLDEGREGFRVAHDQFWLYATGYHQTADALVPTAAPLLDQARVKKPPSGKARLAAYAVVDHLVHVERQPDLDRLAGHHILSDATVRQRFHYRQPGLFVIVVRAYHTPPCLLDETAYFAGCKSWVDLQTQLSTEDVEPVLADDVFVRRRDVVLAALRG